MEKSTLIGLVQRCADFLTVIVSFALGYLYYLQIPTTVGVPYTFYMFLALGTFAAVIFLALFHSFDLYRQETSLLHVVESKKLFLAWGLGSLIVLGANFYFRFLDLSRIMLTVSLGCAYVLLVVERSIFYRLNIFFHMRGRAVRPSLIYGAGIVGKHLYKRIYHSPGLGIHVLGFIDDDQRLWGEEVKVTEIRSKRSIKVLGGIEKLRELKNNKELREVYVALPTASYQRNLEIVQECRNLGLSVSVVPPTYGHQMHALEVRDIGGIPILKEKDARPHLLYSFIKRIFDITVSVFAMVALSPVMLFVALVIKMDSPGPVIFRQKRVGLDGREFDFFKFRSMYVSANPYGVTPKEPSDARITRFGRWLRRSSLDELPQFFNVLRGEMSIVGPRPEMPFIVNSYTSEQRERLKVKPGITGVWQISAVRGEPIHANLEYDLFYIEHRSLILDIIIMIKTLITAVRGIGAV